MTAPQTLVTVSRGVLADHGAIIDHATNQQHGDGLPILFCKVVIPKQSKLPFLRRFHQMNITGSSPASMGSVARSSSWPRSQRRMRTGVAPSNQQHRSPDGQPY